jgi:xylulokinase
MNSWLRSNLNNGKERYSYEEMNRIATSAPVGCDGLAVLPFGNGSERVLQNRNLHASIHGLDLTRHTQSNLLRAGQEGIVFALRYGFDVLKSVGLKNTLIRAGHSNMFLSPVFREAFVNTIGLPLQLYKTDGATGAAIGAGVGAGIFDMADAFRGLSLIDEQSPRQNLRGKHEDAYGYWKVILEKELNKQP